MGQSNCCTQFKCSVQDLPFSWASFTVRILACSPGDWLPSADSSCILRPANIALAVVSGAQRAMCAICSSKANSFLAPGRLVLVLLP